MAHNTLAQYQRSKKNFVNFLKKQIILQLIMTPFMLSKRPVDFKQFC